MSMARQYLVLLGFAAGLAFSASGQSVSIRPVATTLDEVPGVPPSRDFYLFHSSGVYIDEYGRVVFSARTSENNSSFETGIWAETSPGSLENTLIAGVQVPGQDPGVTFSSLSLSGLSGEGVAILDGSLNGPGVSSSNNETLWIYEAGSAAQLLVREGQTQLPGPIDVSSFSFASYSDDQSRTVIHSDLSGPGVTIDNAAARWAIDSGGQAEILTRNSDPAPEFGVDAFYSFAHVTPTAGADAYAIVRVYGDGIDRSQNEAVMLFPANQGPGTIVARRGDPVPGHPGMVHDDFFEFTIAESGAAFLSVFASGSPGVSGYGLLCANPVDGLTLIAATGDPVVGGAPGDTYAFENDTNIELYYRLVDISEDGTVVFASSTGSGSNGLWLYHANTGIQSIAIAGDVAPTPGGSYVFTDLQTASPIINSVGQIVFHAEAVETSGAPTINGVWATTPGGGLVPVLVSGQTVNVGTPGSPILKQVTSVSLQQGSPNDRDEKSPFSSVLNSSGEVVLTAEFTDGAGVFVAHISHCQADTNGDGMLSPADFSAWVSAFNTMSPQCDQNGDGACAPADFSAWVANYNAGC
ncbi:MAG: hypothetical protein KDA31_11765 [Phycisphaerales bacterium]|nr:hypothetical protein [Phycisphaerales bacterium]